MLLAERTHAAAVMRHDQRVLLMEWIRVLAYVGSYQGRHPGSRDSVPGSVQRLEILHGTPLTFFMFHAVVCMPHDPLKLFSMNESSFLFMSSDISLFKLVYKATRGSSLS